jgi:hypothetical protein
METPGRRTLHQSAAIFKSEAFSLASSSEVARPGREPIVGEIFVIKAHPLSWFLHGSLLQRAVRTPHAIDVTVCGRNSAINPRISAKRFLGMAVEMRHRSRPPSGAKSVAKLFSKKPFAIIRRHYARYQNEVLRIRPSPKPRARAKSAAKKRPQSSQNT